MATTNREVTLRVADGSEMGAFVAAPEGERRGGLMLFQEAFGVNAHIRDVAQRLAREGYLTIAPELFHRTARGYQGRYDDIAGAMRQIQAITTTGLEADCAAAHAWLLGEGVASGRLGAIGFCMGGRSAYLAAAAVPLAAAVSYYGGGIAPALLDRAPQMQAPLLLYWGGRDQHIPAAQRRSIAEALEAAGKDYSEVVFSHADHGFHCDERPSYNPAAARESWALTLAFFREHMA